VSAEQGLYRPSFERDSCGFGLIASLAGRDSHWLVATAMSALGRLTHRGAVAADGKTGDGCGILLSTPESFLRAVAAEAGFEPGAHFAAGRVFLDPDPARGAAVRNTMRACLPAMIDQKDGKIVNVGGTFGMRGKAGRLAYSASKWGLRGITKSFALEAGPHNINVNCVAPGMVDGPRFRGKVVPEMAARLGITEDEAVEKHAADYALRRVSTGEDVANACLFLASDLSRQITGVDLPVDGGWAML
jgi:NAD(P)-dependent dehydrogenase (short-subunit alcohol dehydrogenase family)